MCSYKFRKIHRKTPVPGPFSNKVAGLRPSKKFLRTPFVQNTFGRLLLKNNQQTFENLFRIFLIYEFLFRKTGESFIVSFFFVSVKKQYRSSRSEVFCLKDILKNFAKFTGKHLCQSLSLNEPAGFRTQNFAVFKTRVLQNTTSGCF